MIHINPSKDDSRIYSPSKVGGKRRTADKPKQEQPFIDQLTSKLEKIDKQDLDRAIEQIDRAGQVFLDDPSQSNLGYYKKSIGQFLQYITRQTYRVKNIAGSRSNRHQIIETVNQHLEDLTVQIMNNEKDERLMYLKKIGEIRALIINLIL